KFTQKERDNETGLDYFLARYYSSNQGRFTSPDEFTGGPDELYDFAEDASENPTFYADLTNPQSLNKYQYTYNNPINLTDDDGHCPICVAAAAGAVVLILTSPDTTHAPTGNETEPLAPSGDGVGTMLTTAAISVVGGPILNKVAGPIARGIVSRLGGKAAAKAGEQSVGAEVSAGVGKGAAKTSSSGGLGRTATTKTTGAKGQKTTTTVTDPAGSTTYKTTPGKTGGQSTTIVRKDAEGNVKYVKQEARHTTRDFNKPPDHKHYKRPKDKELP
ncbi:MAG: RHS repeat-associated core domain-containing protein, partial [Pyrinomonadaceae bacterium]